MLNKLAIFHSLLGTYFMSKFSPVKSGGNTLDAVNTRAFLQQAVDHYPRLAAFSFTLKLPYREVMSE